MTEEKDIYCESTTEGKRGLWTCGSLSVCGPVKACSFDPTNKRYDLKTEGGRILRHSECLSYRAEDIEEPEKKDDSKKDRFIVIDLNHVDELQKMLPEHKLGFGRKEFDAFKSLYGRFVEKKLDHKYLVINQDEPYVDEVKRIILEGEEQKANKNKCLSCNGSRPTSEKFCLGCVKWAF